MKCRHTYLFAGLCALLFGACTGNFRDINDDLSGITDGELEADNNGLGYRLGIIQQGGLFQLRFRQGQELAFPAHAESQCGHVFGLHARPETPAGREPQLRL